jgi:hypothetical protein
MKLALQIVLMMGAILLVQGEGNAPPNADWESFKVEKLKTFIHFLLLKTLYKGISRKIIRQQLKREGSQKEL